MKEADNKKETYLRLDTCTIILLLFARQSDWEEKRKTFSGYFFLCVKFSPPKAGILDFF